MGRRNKSLDVKEQIGRIDLNEYKDKSGVIMEELDAQIEIESTDEYAYL